MPESSFGINMDSAGRDERNFDISAFNVAHDLSNSVPTNSYDPQQNDSILGITNVPFQSLHMQSLANLLDGYLFWDLPAASSEFNKN
ncbi:uncharacterized protein N7469_004616 [Penicillium citrinum]|uniref:Uncharacterized protein n=1 Tax=Penicillium citrinum TaxID=5077 RepID=A0A9W9TRD0_PENCI|nr:uncharacterized protein N7469_004616 [Penicillium citrinum]KAJ5235448.1 hypothetical protein N7469_004616 [Penicillium citrinum]